MYACTWLRMGCRDQPILETDLWILLYHCILRQKHEFTHIMSNKWYRTNDVKKWCQRLNQTNQVFLNAETLRQEDHDEKGATCHRVCIPTWTYASMLTWKGVCVLTCELLCFVWWKEQAFCTQTHKQQEYNRRLTITQTSSTSGSRVERDAVQSSLRQLGFDRSQNRVRCMLRADRVPLHCDRVVSTRCITHEEKRGKHFTLTMQEWERTVPASRWLS